MLAQRLAGGECFSVQKEKVVKSVNDPASLIYFQRFSAFYCLRPRAKPPHLVSCFHSKKSLAVEMEHLYSLDLT